MPKRVQIIWRKAHLARCELQDLRCLAE
ncbi:hypothetical protein F383_39043 [Gossypium arboreum]|uniref:Uncharacterized protein n=1 Tax=Gossypium arboreum TaxID=29729 RepID=A0A0B0MJY8_GOSAR|nr:hypothetical protein F383_39043 [Gossypium arboreum]